MKAIYLSCWDSVKVMLLGNVTALNGYIRKEKIMKNNDTSIYIKKLEGGEMV
jgi:hypothetical protein